MRFFTTTREPANTRARPLPSSASADDRGFAVIDLETTGLHPDYHHRVVEIAIVELDPSGTTEDEWVTLLNPERDVGPTRIHGIRAQDVVDAPRFTDITAEVVRRIAGRVLVAHNLRFDLRFLAAELAGAGADLGVTDGICTLGLAGRFGIVGERSLAACCGSFDIPLHDQHFALADATAAAALLRAYLDLAGGAARLGSAERVRHVPWPAFPSPREPLRRGARDPAASPTLANFIAGLPSGPELNVVDQEAAVAYLAVLDFALEDRSISDEEVIALASLAQDWGLDQKDVHAIHWSYLEGLRRTAWADGRLSDEERRDLMHVADLLAVDSAVAQASSSPLTPYEPQRAPLAATTVCFTGESVCSVGGRALSRADQMGLAIDAGATVVDTLTRKVDLLVLADPASQSGKARKAVQYGVRRVAEPVFWRMAGVPTD